MQVLDGDVELVPLSSALDHQAQGPVHVLVEGRLQGDEPVDRSAVDLQDDVAESKHVGRGPVGDGLLDDQHAGPGRTDKSVAIRIVRA